MQISSLLRSAKASAITAVLASLVVWLFLLIGLAGPIDVLEERAGDWVWRLAASTDPERRVVVVDIDESSMQKLGAWPWTRDRLAQLSDALAIRGTSLQVFDVVLPSPSDQDERLVASLQRNNGVLSQVFAIQGNSPAQQGLVSSHLDWPACPGLFPVADNYIANAPAFAGLPAGHITPIVSSDGSVRKQPAVICHNNRAHAALFLEALRREGASSAPLSLSEGKGLFGAPWQIQGVGLSSRPLPLDSAGNVRIPWPVHPDALTAIPAHRVLSGDVPASLFQNAWVVIGSTAMGINDRVATPFSGIDAGLLVHAQLLVGVLDDRIPGVPRHQWLFPLAVILLGGGVLAVVRLYRPVSSLIVASVVVAAGAYVLKAILLTRFALWVEWLPGSLYILMLATALSLADHARSLWERDRIYAHLSSYLPAPVAAALAVRDPSDAIDATRSDVIAIYADIRNFSAYCEIRPPEETAAVIHAYISVATDIVERQGGTIESIQGDGILAIWNQSQTSSDPAEKALLAARELLRATRDILPDPDPDNLQSLALGIGLESGPATVGSFGSARRRTHLAMGRPVTVAVRLEKMTAELAHPILIGENLAAYLGPHQLQSQGVFLLEGIVAPCHIYAYPLKNCV